MVTSQRGRERGGGGGGGSALVSLKSRIGGELTAAPHEYTNMPFIFVWASSHRAAFDHVEAELMRARMQKVTVSSSRDGEHTLLSGPPTHTHAPPAAEICNNPLHLGVVFASDGPGLIGC